MIVIKQDNFNLLIAEENKKIRNVDDVYVPEHYEDGELIPEYFPTFFTRAYLNKNIDISKINEFYKEEDV